MSNFTNIQIQRFKRAATALKKEKSISQSEALNCMAKRNGFSNWPLLMKNFNGQISEPAESSLNHQDLLKICLEFIQNLNDAQVFTLCWSGSLWIDREDTLKGQITVDSLYAMGSASDGAIRQYGASLGAIMLTKFDGIADQFVEDEDDFGTQLLLSRAQVIYTPVTGRQVLISCLSNCIVDDFDSLMAKLNED